MDYFKQQLAFLRQYLPEIQVFFNWKDVTKVAGGVLVGVTVIYCGKIWYAQRFFKRMGIPTPKPKFISGNYHEIAKNVRL